jgi:tetratricopeptide (TPR) repeat protein
LLNDSLLAGLPSAQRDEARRLRAGVLLRLNQPADALAELDRLVQVSAGDHLQRSVAHAANGDLTAAIHAVQRALDAAPDEAFQRRALERLVMLLVKAGQFDQADALLAAQPTDWRWLHWRGDLAAERGDLSAAAVYYTAALSDLAARLPPDQSAIAANQHLQLHCKRAAVFRRLRRFDDARRDLALARSLLAH